jgi:hypothetical protein
VQHLWRMAEHSLQAPCRMRNALEAVLVASSLRPLALSVRLARHMHTARAWRATDQPHRTQTVESCCLFFGATVVATPTRVGHALHDDGTMT